MSTENFRRLKPGEGETLPFPLLENLTADEREKADVFSSESFGEIFAAENPMILWAVFLTGTKLDGKSYASMGRARLPRDEVKRLACLRSAKNMLPIGAIWLNTTGDHFRYALLELPLRLWPKERNEKLLAMIQELMRIEYSDPGTLIIDDAFE
jgi:hypothetical protein